MNPNYICMSQAIINKYLSVGQKYINKIPKSNPLTSKEDFYKVLQWWSKLSSEKTIRDLGAKKSDRTAWIHLKLGSNSYYLNADTNKAGVISFLKNKENPWSIIVGEEGASNKVVNTLDQSTTSGFYLYKEK